MKTGVDHGAHSADILVTEAGLFEPGFGFEPGPEFTLDAFQKYADDFKAQYFRKNGNITDSMLQEQWEPSLEIIEGEYWRMVEKPSDEIEVSYWIAKLLEILCSYILIALGFNRLYYVLLFLSLL